jgi:hypothetical protein
MRSLRYLLALCVCTPAIADDEDMLQLATLFPEGRHLAQLTYTALDTAVGDRDIYLAGYTYAYSNSLRFSGNTGYTSVEPPSPAKKQNGMTDSTVLVQYDPSDRLSANAFVPETLGLTFELQLPSGDPDKGTGEDLWAATVGGGWLIDFPYDFWLLPSLRHQWTFSEGADAQRRERTDLGLGLYWFFPIKAWLGLEPVLAYDHAVDDDALDWSLVAGKVWSTGWGIDFSWSSTDRFEPQGVRDDQVLLLTLSYQFGEPPKVFE